MSLKPVLDAAKNRFSPKSYSAQPVDDQLFISLIQGASNSPSSSNEQPWRWIYAHKKDESNFNKLFSCLDEGNRQWAGSAAILMVTLAKKTSIKTGRENRHYWYDTGQAMGHFSLLLTEAGLYMRQMGGFSRTSLKKVVALPDDLEPVSFAAVGYIEKGVSAPERKRYGIDTIILKDIYK